MSHTKRYWIDDHSAIEDSDGKWVLHSDHAALVQQGIRDHADWRSKLNFLEADYKAEIARLTAENERLRKAGDDLMGNYYATCLNVDGFNEWPSVNAWRAAKEGTETK